MMSNPWADVEGVSDRQPAYCPYCGQNNGFDGLGRVRNGEYRHHCADCGQEFITITPTDRECLDRNMVKQKTSGTIGGMEVTIEIEGNDETLANLIYADLVGRCDELNQIAELKRHPDATEPPMTADWEAYLDGEIPE